MTDEQVEVISEEQCFTLWREPHVIIVRLFGQIDDHGSQQWRDRLTAEMQQRGPPRFVAFDMQDCTPKNSMSTRFEVAAYARGLMQRVEWAALLIPSSVGGALVVRVVSSIVATSRISLTASRPAFEAALNAMRHGERPMR